MISPYIDTHAHLYLLEHSPTDEILDRAQKAGVSAIISASTDEKSWLANQQLAKTYPFVFFSLGLHPHEARDWEKYHDRLEALLKDGSIQDRCVAVGETGLDFHYNNSPKEAQIIAFEAQLHLAKKQQLPIIIHCRNAFDELFRSIRKVGLSDRSGVMHCFTGTTKEAKMALDVGLKISFSGIITFEKSIPIREAAKVIPHADLLIETDCPFLAPVPHRGKPNEPAFLPFTAKALAVVLGLETKKVAAFTTQNAIRFFGLDNLK